MQRPTNVPTDFGDWTPIDDLLPKVGDEILFCVWVGWCNDQDESIFRMLRKKPSKPIVKMGEVTEAGNEGHGNFIRVDHYSPDHICCWKPKPTPPNVKPRELFI